MPSQSLSLRAFLWVTCLVLSIAATLTGLWAQAASAQAPADTNPSDPDRQKALQLYRDHKMTEAAALLEVLVARYPKDTLAHEAFGSALLSRATTQPDPEKQKADRLHARAELLRARELGDNSDLCKTLLALIPEDGSKAPFADKAAVNEAMNRGEAAFADGRWQDAIAEYTRALELEPRLYVAALDIGDTYFRLKQTDKAGEWFAKAIEIDPNQEVAYRYWGDALVQDGKMKEARTKFIEGLVAFPYRPTSWNGLNGWVSRNRVKYRDIPIHVPEGPKTGAKGETVVTVDPTAMAKNDSSSAAWLIYPIERARWHQEEFAKEFPEEKNYRHSLKEEVAALSLATTVFEESQRKTKDANPDPGLTLLSRFKVEGMLEPYVLLMKADNGIAQDYSAYRAAHRDKLIEFVDKYVVPPAP
ncbi:MAG TPA: tetratricopeptide repeat protein [Candidatus Angelobacter sp.]|nr:tetratricopeptide repeat protein [Candidatus Angelobacter sp.]